MPKIRLQFFFYSLTMYLHAHTGTHMVAHVRAYTQTQPPSFSWGPWRIAFQERGLMAQDFSGEQIKWIVGCGVEGPLSFPVDNAGWTPTQGLLTKSIAPHVWIADFYVPGSH